MLTLIISSMDTILKILIVFLLILILFKRWKRKDIPLSELGKDGISYLIRRRFAVFLVCVIFLVTYCGSLYLNARIFPNLTIRYNYEEAANGENPNGTRLNISEVFSEEMLQEVIERGNFSVSSEELSDCLSLESAFDERSIDTTELANANIATEYRIVCSPKIALYRIDARTLLELLADVYYEYFIGMYSENTTILELDFDDVNELDYIDLGGYFRIKADKMGRVINMYGQEDGNYHSKTTGETFASLEKKINNFIDIDIERYHSFALGNGLSKDSDGYVTRMRHENRLQKTDYDKQMEIYNVRLEAIEMYDEQMARIVLVPTVDETEEFYMSRTKIGADYFADEADEALNTATQIQEEISHNNYAKNMVNDSEATGSVYDKADEMIVELQDELNRLSEQAQELTSEYLNAKRGVYINMLIPETAAISRMDIIKGAGYTILFGIVLCGYMVVAHSGKKQD